MSFLGTTKVFSFVRNSVIQFIGKVVQLFKIVLLNEGI